MKSNPGRNVKIGVGVVHAVQSPQYWYAVVEAVLPINRQVKHDQEQGNTVEGGYPVDIEQPPMLFLRQHGNTDGQYREQQGEHDTVKGAD